MLREYHPRYCSGWTLHFTSDDASPITKIIKGKEENISEGVDEKEGG